MIRLLPVFVKTESVETGGSDAIHEHVLAPGYAYVLTFFFFAEFLIHFVACHFCSFTRVFRVSLVTWWCFAGPGIAV